MIFDIDKKNEKSIAVIDDGGITLTYGDLVDFCKELKLILPERELVFCLCRNSAPSLAGYVALYDNKDVTLLLNANIERGLYDNLFEIYKPSYIWCPKEMAADLNADIVIEHRGYILGRTQYTRPVLYEDLSLLMTTSGTTGSPKLVRYKYGNIEMNAQNVAKAFEWTSEEKAICDLPMQYTMGLNVINTHLYVGATVLLISTHLLSSKFWEFVKKHKATNFTGVPYSYEILSKLKFIRMDLPDLTTLAEGGGRLSDNLFEQFANYAEMNNKRFVATFGTTETSARLAFLPANMATIKCGSIGFALPGGVITLFDEDGKEITEPNVEGELCYRGPNVTLGYAECSEDLIKGDEFRGEYKTGDVAYKDKDGCHYVVGRKKRFLKIFGLRISLDQCEKIISEEYAIESACSGDDDRLRIYITDESLGDSVKKLISRKTGLTSSVLTVRIVSEIPKNDSGKINYKKLDHKNGFFKN